MKAIIFDVFGVLYKNARRSYIEENVSDYATVHLAIKEVDAQFDYGLISREEHHQAVAEITGLPLEQIRTHIEGKHVRNTELFNYALSLGDRYRIGLLSNIGHDVIQDYFTTEELTSSFDTVVVSGDEGITKPHPHIFEIMAERLGVQTGECLMIDDLASNCAGADAAGMQAIQYISNHQVMSQIATVLHESRA